MHELIYRHFNSWSRSIEYYKSWSTSTSPPQSPITVSKPTPIFLVTWNILFLPLFGASQVYFLSRAFFIYSHFYLEHLVPNLLQSKMFLDFFTTMARAEPISSQETGVSARSARWVQGSKELWHPLLSFYVIITELDQKYSIQDMNLCPYDMQGRGFIFYATMIACPVWFLILRSNIIHL